MSQIFIKSIIYNLLYGDHMKLELEIVKELKGFKVRAFSTFGEDKGFFELDISLISKMQHIKSAIDEQENLEEKFVKELGIKLFNLLFSNIKELLHKCLDKSDHLDVILNVRDPLLNEIPWELCYDPDYNLFLGADPQCSLVRKDREITETFRKIDYPLRILVIVSSPMDLDKKDEYQPDPDEIEDLMNPLKKLVEKGMVTLDFLERASVKHIQDALKKGYHIVHFVGHGFYSKDKTGYLIIEDKDRNTKMLEGKEVAHLFGTNPPQLIILTACESSPLVFLFPPEKIPAVLAMQYTVLKDIAHEFVDRFYSLLVAGDSVAQAVSEARSAVLLEEGVGNPGWFTPVLYMRVKDILKINIESERVIPEKKQVIRSDMATDLPGMETFVGRRNDLWLLEKALFEDKLKMAVVKGIGGIGKTALASKFVKRHKNKFRAVFAKKMVDPNMGVEEILGLLNDFLVKNGDQRLQRVIAEPDLGVKLRELHHCLENKYLIVLDNFETVLEHGEIADKGIEKLLQVILSGDHPTKVIITSRYAFTFTDEKGSGLLKVVDLDELRFLYGVQLLEKLGISDFGMRAQIFERIGGNPQFLEFFVKLAENRKVERLLRDITPVRERISDWLLNELIGLLSEEEKDALIKMAVFRLKIDGDAFDVLGIDDTTVDVLVYYSLVKVDTDYFMHQGVRDYVYVLMSDDEKVEAHFKAVKYYEMLFEKGKADLADILEMHYHLIESGQYDKAGNLILELSEPFLRWGFWWKLQELLVQTAKTTDGRTRAGALHNLGAVLESFGNYEEAEKLYRQSLDIAEKIGDTAGVASSLHQLGIIQQYRGNYEEAEKLYRQSLDIKKEIGDTAGVASSLHQLGMIQEYRGNYEEAEKLYRQSLDILKEIGDTARVASSLHQLGMVQQYRGNYEEAEKLYRQSLDIAKEIGDTAGVAQSLHQLGMVQQYRGNYEEAEKLYRQSLDIAKEIGDTAGVAQSLHQLGIIQEYRGNYEEAVEHYITSLSIFLKQGSPNADIVVESLQRIRGTMGEEQFDNYWKTMTKQDVPDFIKESPLKELEEYIQYIIHIHENGGSDQVKQIEKEINELLQEEIEPGPAQFSRILLDYLSGNDISQKIQDLEEPFKSILEKYLG
jgi:tetratricopeptide (TPR) repeat protein